MSDTLVAAAAVSQLDLDSVRHQMVYPHPGDLGFSARQADRAIELYRHFLELCFTLPVISDSQTEFIPAQTLTGSQLIDWAHHFHVLDKPMFDADCDILGLPLVHFSHGRTMLSSEAWKARYAEGTVEPFSRLWGIDLIAASEELLPGGGEPAWSFDFLGGSNWLRRPALPAGS